MAGLQPKKIRVKYKNSFGTSLAHRYLLQFIRLLEVLSPTLISMGAGASIESQPTIVDDSTQLRGKGGPGILQYPTARAAFLKFLKNEVEKPEDNFLDNAIVKQLFTIISRATPRDSQAWKLAQDFGYVFASNTDADEFQGNGEHIFQYFSIIQLHSLFSSNFHAQ